MSKHEAVDAQVQWSKEGGKAPQLWVLANVDDDWRADLRLCVQGDRLVVAEVRLYPRITEGGKQADFGVSGWDDVPAGDAGAPWSAGEAAGIGANTPEGGISARLLRQIPVHVHETLASLADATGGARIPDAYLHAAHLTDAELNHDPGPRPGRPPIPDERLLNVARIYADAVPSGKPVQAVAGELKVSGSKARDLVHRARQRGLLTRATPGRASGQLTPKATAMLRGHTKKRKSKTGRS